MSAAIGNIVDTSSEGTSVRDWLLDLRGGDAARGGDDATPPAVAGVCSSAVAPLEIAAALEAAGMSQQAVQETTGHHDVFALADELWKTVPYAEPDIPRTRCWRGGNVGDLGRGALYAAPALIIHGLATAGDYRFQWWALPLAMTLGWAMGQLTAFAGYRMRGRIDPRGEARIATLLLLVATIATAACAWAARQLFGGGVDSVLAATAVTTYMVASSILLLHEEERLGALLLAPAAVASIVVLIADDHVTRSVALWTIAASGAATLVAVARHLGWPIIRRGSITRSDLPVATQHFVHGIVCGLALSVILLLGTGSIDLGAGASAVSVPLLLTLGLMEWRLRTFRADVESLALELDAIDQFAGSAVAIFLRGLATYAAGILVVAATVAVALDHRGSQVPIGVLLAQVALGALYYIDLTLTSLGRLDVVLRGWVAGTAAACALVSVGIALGADWRSAGWWSAHFGVWIALTVLLAAAPRIIAAPCSH